MGPNRPIRWHGDLKQSDVILSDDLLAALQLSKVEWEVGNARGTCDRIFRHSFSERGPYEVRRKPPQSVVNAPATRFLAVPESRSRGTVSPESASVRGLPTLEALQRRRLVAD